jgi:hypothetical protein
MGLRLVRGCAGIVAALALGGADWVNPAAVPPATAPTAAPLPPPAAASAAPLEVVGWSLAGGRLTMTLHGNGVALDRMRAGSLAVVVHWVRDSASGAPDLVTGLSVGRPGLVPQLAGEVRRQGYFAWHSWAEKRSLSPGPWTVSLTFPDGRPVPCAPQQTPCRLSFTAG